MSQYVDTLKSLSAGSVRISFNPDTDIAWETLSLDLSDKRWILPVTNPLGAHPWYQRQSESRRIEMGLWYQTNVAKVGLQFESVLIRGMMQYCMKLPNNSAEFEYCMHEIKEEVNHVKMFQRLVDTLGQDVPGMSGRFKFTSDLWGLSAYYPIALFIGILAGEEPIDHTQKQVIRSGAELPGVYQRIMQIHVAEEARHISFAHLYLTHHLKKATFAEKFAASILLPTVMRALADAIIKPPKEFEKRFNVPKKVIREAFWSAPASREVLTDYFGDVRMLADNIGLLNPVAIKLWKSCGVWGDKSRYRGQPHRKAVSI